MVSYLPISHFLKFYLNIKTKGIGKELVYRMLKELEDIYMIDLCCDDDLVCYYEQLGMFKSNGMLIRNYHAQQGI